MEEILRLSGWARLHDLQEAGIDPRLFRKLRDASPGREVKI